MVEDKAPCASRKFLRCLSATLLQACGRHSSVSYGSNSGLAALESILHWLQRAHRDGL